MQLEKPSKPAKMFALMLSVTPAGCLTTTGSGGTDAPFCVVGQAIYWSKADTPKTIVQIKEHNAVGKSLCGWGMK